MITKGAVGFDSPFCFPALVRSEKDFRFNL
jgi:hypothetical protein